MMDSDQKTLLPSLIEYINSDLFTLDNISSSTTLQVESTDADGKATLAQCDAIISYLPLKFFRIIESYPDMYTTEVFDKKYKRNPKLCAYEKYDTTNMWRPLMILNRCPNIRFFDFPFIRYYNIAKFTEVLSVLISRVQSNV
jgi:hypothetical protein